MLSTAEILAELQHSPSISLLLKAATTNPLSKTGFVRLVTDLNRELNRRANATADEVVADALKLLDRDWARLTDAQRKAAMIPVNRKLESIGGLVYDDTKSLFSASGKTVIAGTRRAAARAHRFDVRVTPQSRDERMINRMVLNHAIYFKDQFGKRQALYERDAAQILASGLAHGHGSDQMAKDLGQAFDHAARPESYWATVATAFVARNRSWGNLATYNDAGVQQYEIIAVLDEVTSQICRYLHGKRFSVGAGLAIYEELEAEARTDPEKLRAANPWLRQLVDDKGREVIAVRGKRPRPVAVVLENAEGRKGEVGRHQTIMSEGQLEGARVGPPPYHGRCRTGMIAVL